jgi:hypothetical protein
MSSPRRSLPAVLAVDALALAVIVVSIPVAWLWLDSVRPAGLVGGATPVASPGDSAVASASAGPATGGSGSPYPTPGYGNGSWTLAASMPRPLWGAGSVTLADGRVLVVGGTTGTGSSTASNGTFLYDPRTATWSVGTPMLAPRAYPIVALLADGSVLVAGGSRNAKPLDTAERYLPDSGAWVTAGRMNVPRTHGTATLLTDGRVLLAGGGDTGAPGYKATASAEIYDPVAGTWTVTGSLAVARALHTASRLADGTVLVAGGAASWYSTSGAVAWTTEIYDPRTGTWRKTGKMASPRYAHAAVVLPDGRVLVAGGWARTANDEPSQASAEIYDPVTGQWSGAGAMSVGRARLRMAVLPDGRVLAVGGLDPQLKTLASSDIYDPLTGQWQPTGRLATAVMWPALGRLPDGRVLVAGGATDASAHSLTSVCEIYAPPPP